MAAAQVPVGVTRLPHLAPRLVAGANLASTAGFTEADYVLAMMRYIAGPGSGGRSTMPTWKGWGIRSAERALELQDIARLYVDALQGK